MPDNLGSRCVVCRQPLYGPGRPYGSHKCPESLLRRRERQERAEERRVEEYTIREDEYEEDG